MARQRLSDPQVKDLQEGRPEALGGVARQLGSDVLLQVQARPTVQTHNGLQVRLVAEAVNLRGGQSIARAVAEVPPPLDKPAEADYFISCLKSAAGSSRRALPAAPEWLDSTSPKYLEDAENLGKNLSLYAWLSFKLPQIFHQGAEVPALRSRISRYIEQALLTQAGFGDTSKEKLYGYR